MRDVSQISPPIRIFLAVAALFLVAWMTVLKPKSADVSTTPITTGNVATGKPAVSTAGKMAEKAKSAVENANAKQSAAGSDPGETATKSPATGSVTKSASGDKQATPAPAVQTGDLAGLPAPVVKAIKQQRVMVIGFFTAKSADDRAVRKAMFKADRWDGRVMVKAAPISRMAAWGRVARGVDVEQSPTIVVVGRNLKATALVGYVDTRSIDQAVVDSMRNGGGIFTSNYLRQVNHACASASTALFASPDPNNPSEAPKRLKRDNAIRASLVGDLRGIKAPARYAAFKTGAVADAAAMRDVWAKFAKDIGAHPKAAKVTSAAVAADKQLTPVTKRFQHRMAKQHVLSCVDG
jgi:hypothetical protein